MVNYQVSRALSYLVPLSFFDSENLEDYFSCCFYFVFDIATNLSIKISILLRLFLFFLFHFPHLSYSAA